MLKEPQNFVNTNTCLHEGRHLSSIDTSWSVALLLQAILLMYMVNICVRLENCLSIVIRARRVTESCHFACFGLRGLVGDNSREADVFEGRGDGRAFPHRLLLVFIASRPSQENFAVQAAVAIGHCTYCMLMRGWLRRLVSFFVCRVLGMYRDRIR